jgi:hypothetical protein
MIRQIVLFGGLDAADTFGLWETNGTASGTYELTGISGASDTGLFLNQTTPDFTPFNGEMLFAGSDTAGAYGLWVSNATTAGTYELTAISGANAGGLFDGHIQPQFISFDGEVLFEGNDANGIHGLWASNGTAAGTYELTGISGANASGFFGFFPGSVQPDFMVFNGRVLFEGFDSNGATSLWVTNGTAAGTQELTGISGANANGLFDGGNDDPQFTVFNSEVLFRGTDANGNPGLWETNGTAAGTHELSGITGARMAGLSPFDFTVLNSEVLFYGADSSGVQGLWETDGTAGGTHELSGISGALRIIRSLGSVTSLKAGPTTSCFGTTRPATRGSSN